MASIPIEKVTAVLLADGWHDVVPGTFEITEHYMYLIQAEDGEQLVHGPPGGYTYEAAEPRRVVPGKALHSGPLSAILAVEHS